MGNTRSNNLPESTDPSRFADEAEYQDQTGYDEFDDDVGYAGISPDLRYREDEIGRITVMTGSMGIKSYSTDLPY